MYAQNSKSKPKVESGRRFSLERGEVGVDQRPREEGRRRFPCVCSWGKLHSLCDENPAPLPTPNSNESVSGKQGWGSLEFPF